MPPSITQPGEHLLCKQAEIQSKSLFWLRFRISDEAKYVPKMFLLRWAAQIDQRCVPRCNPQPKAGMAYSLRRCFWAFATLRLTAAGKNRYVVALPSVRKFGPGWNWPTGHPFLQPPHVASATNHASARAHRGHCLSLRPE